MKSFFRPTAWVIVIALMISVLAMFLFFAGITCALDGSGGCAEYMYGLMLPATVFAWPTIPIVRLFANTSVSAGSGIGFVLSFLWTYFLVCGVRWVKVRMKRG